MKNIIYILWKQVYFNEVPNATRFLVSDRSYYILKFSTMDMGIVYKELYDITGYIYFLVMAERYGFKEIENKKEERYKYKEIEDKKPLDKSITDALYISEKALRYQKEIMEKQKDIKNMTNNYYKEHWNLTDKIKAYFNF